MAKVGQIRTHLFDFRINSTNIIIDINSIQFENFRIIAIRFLLNFDFSNFIRTNLMVVSTFIVKQIINIIRFMANYFKCNIIYLYLYFDFDSKVKCLE